MTLGKEIIIKHAARDTYNIMYVPTIYIAIFKYRDDVVVE